MSAEQLYSKYKYIWAQQHNTMDSLFSYIQGAPYIQMDGYGNITVTNTEENIPLPVFCCHLDTVHEDAPEPELLGNDVLTSFNGHGVGGDDKCGIVACIELLEKVPCKCIFFRDEETGCRGAKEYDAKSLANELFCIEIDRRNGSDLITSAYGTKMCSDEFIARIKESLPHCKEAVGAYTDISKLGDANLNMLNISAGYYNPHSSNEYVILSELKRNIDGLAVFAQSIMDKPLTQKEYKRDETTGTYQNNYWWKGKTYHNAQSEPDLYGTAGEDDYEKLQYGSWGRTNNAASDYGSATVIEEYNKKSKSNKK